MIILFLGGTLHNFSDIRCPGPRCQARRMAKAINALKMFLLCDQISFEPEKLNELRDVCIFVVMMYFEMWYRCNNGVEAASIDLHFINNAIRYSNK